MTDAVSVEYLFGISGFAAKGGFFSESPIHFLDLQISKKKLFQKTILSLKFKFPTNNSIL